MAKILIVDHKKCTGCRLCELVCSVKHAGVSNPSRARLSIVKWEAEGYYLPDNGNCFSAGSSLKR